MGAVLNAANEAAVAAFMDGKIAFGRISEVVETTISQHKLESKPLLDDLLDADRWARQTAKEIMNGDAETQSHRDRRGGAVCKIEAQWQDNLFTIKNKMDIIRNTMPPRLSLCLCVSVALRF